MMRVFVAELAQARLAAAAGDGVVSLIGNQ